MGSVNKAFLIGNLGRDAELKFTTGGTAVASFSIATTEVFNDRDGNKKEDTQWHRIVLWGKSAESLQPYLTKGKQICVEGKIQTREWTDKDGKQVKTTEIKADRITLLGGPGGGSNAGDGGGGGGARAARPARASNARGNDDGIPDYSEANDDDIPFAWLMPMVMPLAGLSGVLGLLA